MNIENELVQSILFINFENIDETYPVQDFPQILNEASKNLIGNKCFSLLLSENRIIPKSLSILPFPSLNLKGLIKYIEWTDENKQGGLRQAALIILFKESNDIIFYKYIKIFENLLNEFCQKLYNLINSKKEVNKIDEFLRALLLEIKIILEDLKNQELFEQKSEEFPEDPSEIYDSTEYSFKIIIVGDPEVGKTSIALRFTNQAFLRTYISTIGVNITDKNIRVGNSKIKVIIWDIAGQNKFQTARKNFYRGAEAIILTFDLTNQKSFENLNNWYNDVKKTLKFDHNLVGFLIGNKNDLKEERTIKKEQAETFSNQLNLRYIETSALTGENVMFIFHKIGELLLSNFLNKKI